MSIEMENPKTLLELVDAAANHVAQIRIALMIGDNQKASASVESAADLLHRAVLKADEQEPP